MTGTVVFEQKAVIVGDPARIADIPMLPPLRQTERRAQLRELFDEISRTEEALELADQAIQTMLQDNSIELARVMRANLDYNELKSYLKGLRYALNSPKLAS